MTDLDDLVDEWRLRPDGDAIRALDTAVLPVRASGAPAVLKTGGAEHAHLVLRRWNGDGAARLLRADPHRRAVLLERLHAQSLVSLDDTAACEAVARLYRRLHVPAMPQLRSLTDLLDDWADEFAALPRSAPIPHRLVEQAATLCRELATHPADHVLHGNLHYGNVLAADREPWLAISPDPVNGDPAYEIAPMLWHRWDELTGNPRFGVQRRFYTLIDTAGLDEDRARAWVIVRVVREAARSLHDNTALTRLVTLAKAVQD
ncbi:aminoglycoside phosphotransferase family protein [Mycobacterium sp. NPDC050551]|uniref:aminoglycoside phosphotransferase family protein n=1 Tax=Mycobacterium sp. NPDC050551 TaxID=3155407 RepID=UPI0034185DB7